MSANQNININASLAVDAQSLDQLKLQAKREPGKAIAGAAKQFEAMFLGMVLKGMREATPKDGLFDSEQTRMYTSMLDQQIAQQMAARGTGLAEIMARQLSQGGTPPEAAAVSSANGPLHLSTLALAKLNLDAAASNPAAPAAAEQTLARDVEALSEPLMFNPLQPAAPSAAAATAAAGAAAAAVPTGAASAAQTGNFVNRIWSHAVEAARSIGVPPQFMVGQAALESGWGRHEIRNADGSATHNLFGIKAGRGWNGPVVEKTTTEYVNGVAQKTTAKFRAYSSYGEAFRDYANLLRGNPRYNNALAQGQDARGFARGLQQGGYATDPAYADKLVRVINGNTLRQSLAATAPPSVQVLARR
jgi:flagellar protein FlgJ